MRFKAYIFFRRFFMGVLGFVLIIYFFKGILYRSLINYKEISQRTLIKIENKNIKDDLDFWAETNNTSTIEQIIDFSNWYSTNGLKYTFGKCSTNPNKVIMDDKQTNCIGYSASFHAVLSYLLEKKQLSSKVKSEHKVGQLYLWNFNIHKLFTSPTFRDHDYNVITVLETGKKYMIDPTISVNFGITSVKER